MSVSSEIKETAELINSSANWGTNEFSVFLLLAFIAVVLFVFWFSQKQSTKTTDAMIEISNKSNEAINNNTAAVRMLIDNHKESSKKLNDMHDDIKDIKRAGFGFYTNHQRARRNDKFYDEPYLNESENTQDGIY